MGQAPGFDQEQLLRFPSEESFPSLDAAGFAQIHQEDYDLDDLRFFPSSEGSASASSHSEATSPAASSGPREQPQPQFRALSLRPQFMYKDGLYRQVACRPQTFRFPSSGRNLADLLFGTQPCSLLLLCLDSRDWRAVLLGNHACHDSLSEQARATAMPLPFQA